MNRILVALAVFGAAALLSACGGGKATPAASRTAIGVTATPSGLPSVRHASIPAVDAVLSGDPERLRPLIAFQKMACTATPQGIGPFYCATAEPDGNLVGVIPVAQCEGSFMREDVLQHYVGTDWGIFAVSRVEDGYAVVFQRVVPNNLREGVSFKIENGRVTFINYGCAETPEQMTARMQPQDFVLPPP